MRRWVHRALEYICFVILVGGLILYMLYFALFPLWVEASTTPEFWDEWWEKRSWIDSEGKTETTINVHYPFIGIKAYRGDKAPTHFGTVLQLGAGDGKYVHWMIENGIMTCDNYIAIDFSGKAIELLQAREEQGDFGSCQLTAYQEDATEFSYIDSDSVDFVFTLHRIIRLDQEDKLAALREIRRVLKDGGELFMNEEFTGVEDVYGMLEDSELDDFELTISKMLYHSGEQAGEVGRYTVTTPEFYFSHSEGQDQL